MVASFMPAVQDVGDSRRLGFACKFDYKVLLQWMTSRYVVQADSILIARDLLDLPFYAPGLNPCRKIVITAGPALGTLQGTSADPSVSECFEMPSRAALFPKTILEFSVHLGYP